MDNRYVNLEMSKKFLEAGEGAFAKTYVAKNTIYSLMGGRVYGNKEFELYKQMIEQDFISRGVKFSDQEHQDIWKYG